MKTLRIPVQTLVAAFALLIAPQAAAVTLSLAVEPASELPAIPRVLRVEATNRGPASVELPTKVALQ